MSATIIRETGEAIALDNTFEVGVSHLSIVSDHPIERGVNVSDHSQPRPAEITISGVVTETPLVVAGRSTTFEGSDNRGREVVAALVAAKDDGALLDVIVPGSGLIEGVVVQSIRSTVVSVTATRVSITLRQIRHAEPVSVSIPPLRPSPSASPGLADEQDVGRQPTENPESVEGAESSSVLYALSTAFGWIEE